MTRSVAALTVLLAASTQAAPLEVPVDVGVGPEAHWFFGRLLENRGALPHFALTFNVYAVLDQQFIKDHWERVPQNYRGLAASITEARISPSIFIPQTLYISPKVGALGGTGMYGVTWAPLGLTLFSTGAGNTTDWNKPSGRLFVDADVLLTYLFIHSDFAGIPTTHFLRPGVELRAMVLLNLTKTVLLSVGGGAQVYLPQRLGGFFEVTPFEDTLWLSWFANVKLHVRFPYSMNL